MYMLSAALLWACVRADGHEYADLLANNETNETEFVLVAPPTPAPTNPTSQVNVVTAIESAVGNTPSDDSLKKAMQASLGGNVNIDDIVVNKEYTVEQQFQFGIAVDEPVCKQAVATTFGVQEESVTCDITTSRRLQATGNLERRLAGATVHAVIRTTDAAKADEVKATGADTAGVQSQLATNYAASHELLTGDTITVPAITASAPTLDLVVTYEIKSQSAVPVAPPTAQALREAFDAEGGDLAGIANTITVTTPTPTAMPTPLPTPLPLGQTYAPTAPTKMPTAAPTNMPTATPTKMPTAMPTAAQAPTTSAPTSAPTTAPTPAPEGIAESAAFSLQFSVCARLLPIVCTGMAAVFATL